LSLDSRVWIVSENNPTPRQWLNVEGLLKWYYVLANKDSNLVANLSKFENNLPYVLDVMEDCLNQARKLVRESYGDDFIDKYPNHPIVLIRVAAMYNGGRNVVDTYEDLEKVYGESKGKQIQLYWDLFRAQLDYPHIARELHAKGYDDKAIVEILFDFSKNIKSDEIVRVAQEYSHIPIPPNVALLLMKGRKNSFFPGVAI